MRRSFVFFFQLVAIAIWVALQGPAFAQVNKFDPAGIYYALAGAGVLEDATFLQIGVPYGDLTTGDNQRRAINDALSALRAPEFNYLDRSQLRSIVPMVGNGNDFIDKVWASLNANDPGLAGLIFFFPNAVKGNQAQVTPRIILRDGRTLDFKPVNVEVPEAESALQLDKLLGEFGERIADARPKSESLALSVEQDGILSPPSGPSDCRVVVDRLLKKAISAGDAGHLTGDGPRIYRSPNDAKHIVQIQISQLDESTFLSLQAPALDLYEAMIPIQTPRCKLAQASWADTSGTLLERLLAWQVEQPGPLSIAVAEPPLTEGQHEDFLLTGRDPNLWHVCAFVDGQGQGLLIPRPFKVSGPFAFPSQSPIKVRFDGGFGYVAGGRSLVTCMSGPDKAVEALAGPRQVFVGMSSDQSEAWIDRAMAAGLQASSYEYFVDPAAE